MVISGNADEPVSIEPICGSLFQVHTFQASRRLSRRCPKRSRSIRPSRSPTTSCRRRGTSLPSCPLFEDFELQLERSIENLDGSASNVIFDRCPADILGYLLSHTGIEAFDLEEWLPRVRTAIRKLDLVAFLPIEEPDRIVLPLSQDAAYRQRVDEKLKEIILEHSFDFEVDVLEVTGSPQTLVEPAVRTSEEKKRSVCYDGCTGQNTCEIRWYVLIMKV